MRKGGCSINPPQRCIPAVGLNHYGVVCQSVEGHDNVCELPGDTRWIVGGPYFNSNNTSHTHTNTHARAHTHRIRSHLCDFALSCWCVRADCTDVNECAVANGGCIDRMRASYCLSRLLRCLTVFCVHVRLRELVRRVFVCGANGQLQCG